MANVTTKRLGKCHGRYECEHSMAIGHGKPDSPGGLEDLGAVWRGDEAPEAEPS